MLLLIIQKELLAQLLTFRFVAGFIVSMVVFPASFMVMAREYGEATQTYERNRIEHHKRLLERTHFNEGIIVDRPPNVLEILVGSGVTGTIESVRIKPGNRFEFFPRGEKGYVHALFPGLHFVAVVGVIMSFLALTISYDSFSGERQTGVLKLLMSYALPRDLVILGKWIGGYIALLVPLVLSCLICLILAELTFKIRLGFDDALSLIALFGLVHLYLSAVYSMGLLVSIRTGFPGNSIMVLLVLWIVITLFIPNIAPYLARQLFPVEPRVSVDRKRQEIFNDTWHEVDRIIQRDRIRSGKNQAGQDGQFESLIEFKQFESLIESKLEIAYAQVRKLEKRYESRVQAQARLAGILSRLSPLGSFQMAANDLGTVGIRHEARFVETLEAYSHVWGNYVDKKWAILLEEDVQVRRWPPDLSDYPRFKFDYISFRERLDLVLSDLLLLLLWNIVLFMGTYISFLRCEIN